MGVLGFKKEFGWRGESSQQNNKILARGFARLKLSVQ
jgi:hypothetical protein